MTGAFCAASEQVIGSDGHQPERWSGNPRVLSSAAVTSLPLPLIVHVAEAASKAAAPSLRDACGTFDPTRHDEESGIYEGAGGE
jgi:hypothetical protein